MSGLTVFTFVLVALSCYAVSSSSKAQQQQQQHQHQASKKVDLAHRPPGGGAGAGEHFSAEHQTQLRALDSADEGRAKRSQRDVGAGVGDYRELSDMLEDLEDNSLATLATSASSSAAAAGPAAEFDLENMPPLTYYLLLQKLKQLQSSEPAYRVRTPRLGRSIDFQLDEPSEGEDEARGSNTALGLGGLGGLGFGTGRLELRRPQFVTRYVKKSVPFKPRLGKRGQVCE